MSALESLHYHVADDPVTGPDVSARSRESFPAGADAPEFDAPALPFTSNEAAARFYLDEILRRDSRPALESLVEPDRAERVPSLILESEQDLRRLGTRQVRFAQTARSIPVFGAGAVVELNESRELVSVNARLDEVSGVDPVESLSRSEALERLAQYTGVDIPAEAGVSGRLNFYKDEDAGSWHLAWFFPGIPAEPPPSAESTDIEPGATEGHGLGRRPIPPSFDYLIDAHDGEILYCYSAVPTALPRPTRCKGTDEDGVKQTFLGKLASPAGTACQLDDPLRAVRTYDLEFADLDSNPPVPNLPVQADSSDFGTAHRAAVSAHLNASRVQDFYKVVLQRDGIDDRGMDLVSLVNATASSMEEPPGLLNAFWWKDKMWYGQIPRNGRLVSLSRHLDIIGHELTHGVIASTSNLVYATQSGALNESFADIAGIIINNWYNAPDPEDVGTWNWELGAGLRDDGRPLRDFADPARTGHPSHMDQFRALGPGVRPGPTNDNGWVHRNSNIHNKAVHNLLTMSKNGERVFSVRDVAVLTYLAMARLTPRATFAEALQSIVDVAQTYFGGDSDKKDRIDAIREAYRLVGIAPV
ncbi:M4 family metallopeptidase [Nocardia amamiensis]|uniref:Neutral metalloproteinase n=1 Tax=Nocardia amamiensis TaxID=404578 RepID=A0ABS0D027_9NOCA|nr:M4 family metallopeptidase [Nocardia amamiensis]MBF6302191.1 M4 family metallopeptidase [Nocardia amamiensis]